MLRTGSKRRSKIDRSFVAVELQCAAVNFDESLSDFACSSVDKIAMNTI